MSEAEHMTCVVESGIAEQPVYGVQCTPGIDYEQLLIAKNAEIKRLQVLCEELPSMCQPQRLVLIT